MPPKTHTMKLKQIKNEDFGSQSKTPPEAIKFAQLNHNNQLPRHPRQNLCIRGESTHTKQNPDPLQHKATPTSPSFMLPVHHTIQPTHQPIRRCPQIESRRSKARYVSITSSRRPEEPPDRYPTSAHLHRSPP